MKNKYNNKKKINKKIVDFYRDMKVLSFND